MWQVNKQRTCCGNLWHMKEHLSHLRLMTSLSRSDIRSEQISMIDVQRHTTWIHMVCFGLAHSGMHVSQSLNPPSLNLRGTSTRMMYRYLSQPLRSFGPLGGTHERSGLSRTPHSFIKQHSRKMCGGNCRYPVLESSANIQLAALSAHSKQLALCSLHGQGPWLPEQTWSALLQC